MGANLATKMGRSLSPHFLLNLFLLDEKRLSPTLCAFHEARTMLHTSQSRPAYKMEKYGLKPPPNQGDREP
jgi:hypothetical protein